MGSQLLLGLSNHISVLTRTSCERSSKLKRWLTCVIPTMQVSILGCRQKGVVSSRENLFLFMQCKETIKQNRTPLRTDVGGAITSCDSGTVPRCNSNSSTLKLAGMEGTLHHKTRTTVSQSLIGLHLGTQWTTFYSHTKIGTPVLLMSSTSNHPFSRSTTVTISSPWSTPTMPAHPVLLWEETTLIFKLNFGFFMILFPSASFPLPFCSPLSYYGLVGAFPQVVKF